MDNEIYVGRKRPRKRGLGSKGKALVGIAVENKEEGITHIRLCLLKSFRHFFLQQEWL